MIKYISNFITTIVCTVMMIVIIKMIIPEGKNKKYIIFVCGIITTLAILEPLLKFMNLDLNEVLANNEIKYNEYKVDDSLYKDTIKKSYNETLVNDVINRLKENGYNVSNVKIEYDNETLKPNKVYLNLEDDEGYIQPVKIQVSNSKSDSNIDVISKSKITEIIKSNYGIDMENIFIY